METSPEYPKSGNLTGSYPTYEEWKPSFLFSFIFFLLFVLILPMRNKKQRDAHIARLYNLTIYDGYNMFL